MTDVIEVSTSLRIERPPSVVRAQYRDIDHHIRRNVHPGILYKWVESKPGERKIRTEFRLLGVKQFDVSLLVDTADGAFLIDYLEGANAGTKLLHEFVPEGDDGKATLVRITAKVPPTFVRKVLGPFFKLGVKQVIDKALREDKADIEGSGYEPDRAAGNLEKAFALLAPLTARVRSLEKADAALAGDVAKAALELASMVAAADAEVDTAERDALRRVAHVMKVPSLDDAWVDASLETSAKLAQGEEIVARAESLGRRWKELGLKNDGLVPAAIVAQSSFGVALAELALLRCVVGPAGLAESDVEAALKDADDALGNGRKA